LSFRLVQAFRSARHEGMFVIVDRAVGIEVLPAALSEHFGPAEPSIVFKLSPDRAMTHADPKVVLAAIEDKGFYLQLPPAEGDVVSAALAAAARRVSDGG